MFLLTFLPESIDLLWHLLCTDENLVEQSHEEMGGIFHKWLWAPGQAKNLPKHPGYLQRINHPETALSAE